MIGQPIRILETVFIGKQTDVKMTVIHLGQINFIRPAVGSGQVFKQKNIEETTEQRVAVDIIL